MIVLEVADAAITLWRDGEVVYREPGVALVDGREVLFGHPALAQSRLRPRQMHNAFWQRLNADPVTPPGRAVANQADLVYLHLRELRAALGSGEAAEAVAAVPSTATAEQLSLLLGIGVEAGWKITAFVDAAVAAASAVRLAEPCRVVDVGLHGAAVSTLKIADAAPNAATLQLGPVAEAPAAGLVAMMEGWIDAVADRFVDSTRFDPLRVAATEQQVFDQIGAGIEREVAEFAIEVRHGDTAHRVAIARQALAQKAEQRYRLLAAAAGEPATLALTHRALRPPGLAASLAAAGHRLARLPEDAVPQGLARHAEQLAPSEGGARLVTALPARPAAHADTPAPPSPTPATHLLRGAIALPLADDTAAGEHPLAGSGDGFRVARRGASVAVVPTRADVRVNGEPVEFEQAAGAGDVIRCGDVEFRLIAEWNGAQGGAAGR